MVALLLLAVAHLAAAKEPAWVHGRVISQALGSSPGGAVALPLAGTVVTVPVDRTSNVIVVDVENYRYTYAESIGKSGPLLLVVNDDVRFYKEKEWRVFVDEKGQKHRFSVVGIVKNP